MVGYWKFKMSGYTCCVLFTLLGHFFIQNINASNPSDIFGDEKKSYVRAYHTLRNLALHEKWLYKIFKDYSVAVEEDVADQILRYLRDYQDTHRQSGENISAEAIADHPLFSTRMVFRYVFYLKPIIKYLEEDFTLNDALKVIIKSIDTSTGWPSERDLYDLFESILRIHHIHDFDVYDIVNGDVFSSEFKTKLNEKICFEIGKFAITERFFSLAVEWLETTVELIQESDNVDILVSAMELETALLNSFYMHDEEWLKSMKVDPMFFNERLATTSDPAKRIKRRTNLYNLLNGERDEKYNHFNFWSLCKGDDLRTEEEKANLFCWLDRTSNPAWYINPLQIERLAWSPDVVQIYNVISNTTISNLIRLSEPRLAKSTVHEMGGKDPFSKHRTSTTAWLREDEFPELSSLQRRIELMTGLVVSPPTASELLQVASYSFGNRYEVHKDALEEEKDTQTQRIGDRIATFMIYLNDVQLGGYTAFPQAGIAARPIRGSAVFWFNIRRNILRADQNSYHGGCPVIIGRKWIANKWIRSFDQFRTRPCTLDPDE